LKPTPIAVMDETLNLLRALAERMEDYGINANVRMVAAVILETARDLDWAQNPEGVTPWLLQLALELAQTSPVGNGQVLR
jgi:hypothetical protein